jgi:nicotinamidase-related amidase
MLSPKPASSLLMLIDFQTRLAAAIDEADAAIANARRLAQGAALLGAEIVATVQNPEKLGPIAPDLMEFAGSSVSKMTFDAVAAPNFPRGAFDGRVILATGFEAHVCVLQTVLALRAEGRPVFVVADAIGSRRPESKQIALRRMERHGAEIVTTEMVLFEWLASADHPHFRDISRLVK